MAGGEWEFQNLISHLTLTIDHLLATSHQPLASDHYPK